MTVYGTASTLEVEMLGPFSGSSGGGGGGKAVALTLPEDGWKGAASPYSQVVEIEAATVNTKVDLTAGEEVLTACQGLGMGLMAVNDTGTITVFCFGQKPAGDLTVTANLTEVTNIG